MSCDRVVVTGTSSTGGNSSVSWRALTVPGLTKFLITFSQGGEVKNFEAAASATSKVVAFAAAQGCTVTVTPADSTGPLNDKASAAVPVPFPPVPVDPEAGRPITLRICSDTAAGTVVVDWLPSTILDLAGYILTIFEGTSGLRNFDVPDASAVTTTVTYTIDAAKNYSVILTPYDDLSPVKASASYPVGIPYPAPTSIRMHAYLADADHLPLRGKIRHV